jgi:hypothetical protein
MPKYPNELVSPTSLALVRPLLAALQAGDSAVLKPTSSLPAPCFWVPTIRTIVCATSINTLPIFRASMVSVAATDKVDAILIQHGLFPETLDDVTIDVVLGRHSSVRMLWSLCRYRGGDGSTALVPPSIGSGPSVRLDGAGLTTMTEPPYRDSEERSDGLSRAARETVLAMRRLRRS